MDFFSLGSRTARCVACVLISCWCQLVHDAGVSCLGDDRAPWGTCITSVLCRRRRAAYLISASFEPRKSRYCIKYFGVYATQVTRLVRLGWCLQALWVFSCCWCRLVACVRAFVCVWSAAWGRCNYFCSSFNFEPASVTINQGLKGVGLYKGLVCCCVVVRFHGACYTRKVCLVFWGILKFKEGSVSTLWRMKFVLRIE